MIVFFTVIHVLLCVFMIFVILLQPGKDAGMGAALGGGAATSAFGGRGAVTFLSKLTAVCAGLFFLTSLGLSFVGVRASVTSSVAAKAAAKPAPAPAPAPGSAAPAPEPAQGTAAPAPKASDAEPAPAPTPAPAAPAQK
jgi:preprotein translocase subunit SecG